MPPVFACTVNATVPLPLPLASDVMLIHPAVVVAVQLQSAAAVTVTGLPHPPAAPMD